MQAALAHWPPQERHQLATLATDLDRQGVRLVLAAEIGQVRDMVAAVSSQDRTPQYHRTVHDAVAAARTTPAAEPAEER
jgi:hypothetical protein